MRTIGVVTVGRSDYSSYVPVLRRMQAEGGLTLHLIAAGMHLSPEFGLTVEAIEADGFPIADRVPMSLSSDTPQALAMSMGLGTMGFAQVYARSRPDLLLVLGDRIEMHAAVVAAVPFNVPIAHIAGGEVTEGAIDDALRHSITKLSHLHFVTNQEHARRVAQMGEEPWRIVVAGAPTLDNLRMMPPMSQEELATHLGRPLATETLLVTYHPVTREYERTEWQMQELLEALQMAGRPALFTLPNADTNGRLIARLIEAFVARVPTAHLVANLGTRGYYSLMSHAAAMVGNSSSGMIEAPSFGLPVVNVGTRQQGRLRARNVIDVGYHRQEILAGIRRALEPEFRTSLRGLSNPYGNGQAAEIIVKTLKDVALDERLIRKRFVDVATSAQPAMACAGAADDR